MGSEKDPAKANPSEPQFQQTALRDVTARDIQVGQIVQKIVYLGLPFNSQHLRFVQFLANTVYVSLLLGGFWRLWQQGADWATLLMLLLGSGLLCLTCLYYARFWKPERQDKGIPNSEPTDSDEFVQREHTKHQSRQLTRRMAMIGFVTIPLLTWGGYEVWRALPSPQVLVLVANFANAQNADYRDDRGVTENILKNLQEATKSYADVKVQALDQTIRVQEGSEVARVKGEQRKAAIVIWGDYVPTDTHVQISVHY